ncbi:hypothetical protein PSN01_00666 [Micromonospora saelicesensis]|nr:hypothetical protein PSN01_00666 [Micromonospora saelicesensis]
MQSRSAPALRARTAAGPTPPAATAAPFISSASVMTVPVKPYSVRSRSTRTARLKVAGSAPVSAGTRMCAVITARAPAATMAAKGGRSRWRSRLSGASTVGSSWWESVTVAPCPGKCLAQAATPAACNPATAAAEWAATRTGSAPKDRVPITGLSSAVLTSTVGARLTVMPSAASSAPIDW